MYLNIGTVNRILLKREWTDLCLKERGNMEEHLRRFEELVMKLKAAKVKLEHQDIMEQLLMSLPSSYNVVVSIHENEVNLKIEQVKQKLLNEYVKLCGSVAVSSHQSESAIVANRFDGNQRCSHRSYENSHRNHENSQRSISNDNPGHGESIQNQSTLTPLGVKCYNCGKQGHIRRDCLDKLK